MDFLAKLQALLGQRAQPLAEAGQGLAQGAMETPGRDGPLITTTPGAVSTEVMPHTVGDAPIPVPEMQDEVPAWKQNLITGLGAVAKTGDQKGQQQAPVPLSPMNLNLAPPQIFPQQQASPYQSGAPVQRRRGLLGR